MAGAPPSYDLEFRPYRRKFLRPVVNARGPWSVREGIIVRLTDDSGCIGYGEVAPVPGFGRETVAADAAWLRRAGRKIFRAQIRRVPASLACLRWALECALAMLEGSFQPPRTKPLPVAALLPAGRGALKSLRARAAEGYRVFKWKVAVLPPAEELGLLRKLLEHLPRGGKLRLDANRGLDAQSWRRWREELQSLGLLRKRIEFFEEPTRARANHAAPMPVAFDESVAGLGSLRRAPAGYPLVVKPSLLGDLPGFLRWRARTRRTLIYSAVFETSVGLHAALCVAAGDSQAGKHALGFGTLDAFPADGLQLPIHVPGPVLRPAKLTAGDFSKLWGRLS